MTHLLLVCPRLQQSRTRHLNKIKTLMHKLNIDIPTDNVELAYTLLNCGSSERCPSHKDYLKSFAKTLPLVRNNSDSPRQCSYNGHKLCMCTKLNYAVNDFCIDMHNVRSTAINCGSEGSWIWPVNRSHSTGGNRPKKKKKTARNTSLLIRSHQLHVGCAIFFWVIISRRLTASATLRPACGAKK